MGLDAEMPRAAAVRRPAAIDERYLQQPTFRRPAFVRHPARPALFGDF